MYISGSMVRKHRINVFVWVPQLIETNNVFKRTLFNGTRQCNIHIFYKIIFVKEGNVLFNDTLNTFYLRLYGVRHMVEDHSDSEWATLSY